MRKKLFILAALLLCGCLWQANAQTNSSKEALERAISLYKFDHWTEARTELLSLREKLSSIRDKAQIEQIDYYLALCDSQLKMRDAEGRMKRYLAEYGGSAYANDVQFALGAYYCMVGDDEKAAADAEAAKAKAEEEAAFRASIMKQTELLAEISKSLKK